MTSVKEVVISLIFSSVTIGLCELFVPANTLKNQMRLITGSILIISMITPFLNGIDISDFEIPNADYKNYSISDKTERAVAISAKEEISEILNQLNINDAVIKINTLRDENNSILIESVLILFDEKDKSKSEKTANRIYNSLGFVTETGVINNE